MPAHRSGLRGTAAGVPAIPKSREVPDRLSVGAQGHTGKWQSGGQRYAIHEMEWRADGPGYHLVLVPEVSGSTRSRINPLPPNPPFACTHPDSGPRSDHNGLWAAWTRTDLNYAELLCIGHPTRHTSSPQGRGRPCDRQACPWWSGYEQPCGAFRFHCKRPHTPALVGMQGIFAI